MAIEGIEMIAVFFGHDREAHRRIGLAEGTGIGARMLTAATAFVARRRRTPAAECEALALESWEGGELLASASGLFWSAALVALLARRQPARRRLARDRARAGAPQRLRVLDLVGRAVDRPAPAGHRRSRGGGRVARPGQPAPGAVGLGADGHVVGARPARLPRRADRRRRRRARDARRGAGRRGGVRRGQPLASRARRAAARRRAGRGGTRRRRADGPDGAATCCTPTGSRGSR